MNQKNKYKIQKNWFYIISFCLFLDQISKILIQINLEYLSSISIISDYLKFSYITNPGIALGIKPFDNSILLLLVSIIAIFFIFKILITSSKESLLNQVGLCFMIGGALGNVIDRFFTAFNIMDYKGVIDFIDIGINDYRFYIFNFADSFITIGIILYLFSFMKIKFLNGRK